MNDENPKSVYLPEATGKNRTGKVTYSPISTILAREPLGSAKSQAMAEEYPAATPVRKLEIVNALTVGNARLGVSLLVKRGRYLPEDALGLLFFANQDALESYDPTKSLYTTYLAQWIANRGIREKANSFDGSGVRRNVNDQVNVKTIDRLRGALMMRHGREPAPEEILEEAAREGLKLSEFEPNKIEEILLRRPRRAASFDKPLTSHSGEGDTNRTLYNVVSSTEPSPFVEAMARLLFPKLERIEHWMHTHLVCRLDLRYQRVLNERLKGSATLQEVGNALLISRERVRQIEGKLLEFMERELGITGDEFHRLYETLQQCERMLGAIGEPRWERPDSAVDVRSNDDKTIRPIQEILSVIETHLAQGRTEKIITRTGVFLPDLTTLQQIQASKIEAKIQPPRFALRSVYQILWETRVPSRRDLRQSMICNSFAEILETRLGLDQLYVFLALHALIARKLVATVANPKPSGGEFQLMGSSPDEIDWSTPDSFDGEPLVFVEARPCRVLHLLPEERRAWIELERCIETGVPVAWSTALTCSEDAWHAVLAHLLKAQILVLDGGCLSYSADRPDLRVEDIETREPCYCTPGRVELIRAIQAQFRFNPGKGAQSAQFETFVLAWAKEHGVEPRDLLFHGLLSRSKPTLRPKLIMGVVRRLHPDLVSAVSVEGLEAFQFIAESPEELTRRRRLATKGSRSQPDKTKRRNTFNPFDRRVRPASQPVSRPFKVVEVPSRNEESCKEVVRGSFLQALTAFRERLRHALAQCDRELDLLTKAGG